MKRLGTVFILSSMCCLLAACGSEIEMVHNEAYHGPLAVTDTSNEEKYMEKPTNDESTDDTQAEERPTTPEKEDSNTSSSVRDELLQRAEANKEKKEETNEKTQESAKPPVSTKPQENIKPNDKPATTKPQSENPKEKVEEQVKVGGDAAIKDWKGTIAKISKEKTDQQAKIRKLITLNEQYVRHATDKEVQQFKKTLMDDFVTGEFTNAIGNDQAMLTYIFKAYIVGQKIPKKNDYSLFMFVTTFQKFLKDIYLVPNTITDEELDKRIDKLYQIYTTIE